MRADAIRNRAKILQSAREQITQHGPDVGMDEIAARAGVAVGTLYRHFPTKTDLVSAVVSDFVVEVADQTEAALALVGKGKSAFDVLAGLVRAVAHAAAANQAVKTAAGTLNTGTDDSADVQRAFRALQSLINLARADGAVRADLSLDDFYLMVTNAPADQPPGVLDRWVDLMLFGIAGPASQ
jgi:AcrR family transcriptional regulator